MHNTQNYLHCMEHTSLIPYSKQGFQVHGTWVLIVPFLWPVFCLRVLKPLIYLCVSVYLNAIEELLFIFPFVIFGYFHLEGQIKAFCIFALCLCECARACFRCKCKCKGLLIFSSFVVYFFVFLFFFP